MQVYMARIFNPAIAVVSVPISIRIDHIQVSNNNVYNMFYDTFDLFLNSQTPTPVADSSMNADAVYGTILSGDVGNINWFRFYPTKVGSTAITAANGFYYVLDMTTDFYVQSR